MKHAAPFLLFFAVLWWLWQLLGGEWSRYEWIAGACAAAIGATLGEIARTRAAAGSAPSWRALAGIPSALGMVFVDFAIVLYALVTRRVGSVRSADADDPVRAYLATLSPNAYPIDERTVHHLVPNRRSQDPV